MRTRFYYLRDTAKRPLITVCTVESDGVYARGIAFCSPSENAVKAQGRRLSFMRAYAALNKEQNLEPVMRDEILDFYDGIMVRCEQDIQRLGSDPWETYQDGELPIYKGLYKPVLNNLEKRTFSRIEENHN